MDELAAWLLERIAEDEAAARAATDYGHGWGVGDFPGELYALGDDSYTGSLVASDLDRPDAAHIARWGPARVLAECAAKRRILELHPTHEQLSYRAVDGEMYHPPDPYYCDCQYPDGIIYGHEPCDTKRILALPYADHPGYRE